MPSIEYKPLQHNGHQIQPKCRTNGTRQQEKCRARFMRFGTEPLLQISIDGSKIEAVIKRQQHQADYGIAYQIAQSHLHIAEGKVGAAHIAHRTRYRNKRNPAHAGAYHPKGNHIPRRGFIANEEALVAILAACKPRYQQ